MQKLVNKFSVLLVVLLFCCKVEAQSYNTAFGFRFGDDLAFDFTQRLGNHITLNGQFSDGLLSNNRFVKVIGRKHHSILTRRLNFFLGAGAYNLSFDVKSIETDNYTFSNRGVLGIMGAEITIGRINLSIDYMPQYVIKGDYIGNRMSVDSAVSLKYVLWKRKSGIRKFFEKIF